MKKLTVKDLQAKKNVILLPKQQREVKGGTSIITVIDIDAF